MQTHIHTYIYTYIYNIYIYYNIYTRTTNFLFFFPHTSYLETQMRLPTGVLALLILMGMAECCLASENSIEQYREEPWAGRKLWWQDCEEENADCFAKTALSMWRDGQRIAREHIDEAFQGKGEQCHLIQILNGSLHLVRPKSWSSVEGWRRQLYGARIDAYLDIVKLAVVKLNKQIRSELVVCLGDCVSIVDPSVPMRLKEPLQVPNFAVVKCHGSSTLPLPMFDFFRDEDVPIHRWDAAVKEIEQDRDKYAWQERIPKMVFRGGTPRACDPNANEDGFSNVDLNDMPWGEKFDCGRGRAMKLVHGDSRFNFQPPPPLRMKDHEKYKYALYAHGHCHWANRLRRLLFMGTALFKQVGLCEEFYGLRLRPWVHYIPVDYRFNNLTKSLEWAMEHDAEVQEMIKRMHEYAHRYNTVEFAISYTASLLEGYAKLLDYEVTERGSTEIKTI